MRKSGGTAPGDVTQCSGFGFIIEADISRRRAQQIIPIVSLADVIGRIGHGHLRALGHHDLALNRKYRNFHAQVMTKLS